MFAVALTVAGGGFSAQYFAHEKEHQLREDLLNESRAIARTMYHRRVASLTFSAQDLEQPEHARLSEQLRAHLRHLPTFRWIYLMAERNGVIVFGPDNLTTNDPDYSAPGEIYTDAPPALREVFRDGQDRVSAPYTDRWGSFVSAFVSVNDPRSGQTIAVLGLDIHTEHWAAELRQARQIPLLATIVLLVLGLLIYFAAGQARKRTDPASRPWHTIIIALYATLSLLLTGSATALIHHQTRQNRQATFKAIGSLHAQGLNQALRTARDQINSAADFVQSSKNVTRQEFHTFTASLVQRGLLRDLAWAPVVPADRVDELEAHARQQGFAHFRIWEPGPQNQPQPRSNRAFYYPLLFIEPEAEGVALLGRDVGSDSLQQSALLDTLASGLTTATDPMPRLEAGSQARVVAFQRVLEPQGAIVATPNLEPLFNRLRQQMDCDVSLFQLDPNRQAPQLVAATCPEEAARHGVDEGLLQHEEYHLALRHPVFVFGRCYLIVVHPTRAWMAAHPLWISWFVAAVGILLTLVGSFFVAHLLHQPRRLESLVASRTQDLQASEIQLKRLNRLHVALSRLNEAVVRVKSRAELFETVCRIMTEVVQVRLAWIGWVEEATGRILVQTQHGDTTGYLEGIQVSTKDEPAGQGFCGTCIRENRTCVCDDILADDRTLPWREYARKAGLFGLAALPIHEKGAAQGVLTLYAGEPHFFGEPERALMEEAAASVSFALDHLSTSESHRGAEVRATKLLQAIEHSPASIVIADREGRIEYVNPKFTQVTGYTAAEALGQNPRILKSGEKSAQEYQALWATLLDGREWRGEFHNRRKDGTLYWELASLSPLRNEQGEITHFVAVKEDITEKKLAEQETAKLNAQLIQAQKMDSIGKLAGGIAHDFNNILQAISGFSEILRSSIPAGDPSQCDIKEILKASDRATSLTRQLLAFSRQQALTPRVTDLNNLLEQLHRMLIRLVGEDIRIRLELEPSLRRTRVDPGQIEQVIMNLTVNARDAIGRGGGTITIQSGHLTVTEEQALAIPEGQPGDYVLVDVTDTGAGIAPAVLPRIFEPFFTTKESGQGTGMGLSVVYGIIRQHQGFIQVTSELGCGTRFRIALPAYAGLEDNEDHDTSPEDLTRWMGQGERLLIIEDEPGVQDLLRQILTRMNYQPLIAGTLTEARALLASAADLKLVLSDVVLPDGNGLEFAVELQALQPGLPVLLASGYTADRSHWPEIQKQGIPFLQKPYAIHQLLRALHQLLAHPT